MHKKPHRWSLDALVEDAFVRRADHDVVKLAVGERQRLELRRSRATDDVRETVLLAVPICLDVSAWKVVVVDAQHTQVLHEHDGLADDRRRLPKLGQWVAEVKRGHVLRPIGDQVLRTVHM